MKVIKISMWRDWVRATNILLLQNNTTQMDLYIYSPLPHLFLDPFFPKCCHLGVIHHQAEVLL